MKPTRRLRVKTKFDKAPPGSFVPYLVKPKCRLVGKQKPRDFKQEFLSEVDDWEAQEKACAHKAVYLVTLPHPKRSHAACGTKLVAPGTRSKKQILQCFLDAAAHPTYTDGRSLSRGLGVKLKQAGVWREFHQPDGAGRAEAHFHISVLGCSSFRFLPMKKALLSRHGFASHWSCTHIAYWSAVRYCAVPSPKKPAKALDVEPELWPEGEHPPLHECREEPMTAAALRKRSETKYMSAAEQGKPEKITELDVWPIVVAKGFRDGPDENVAHLKLIQYAKGNCSKAMQSFLFKRRHALPQLIESVWMWETCDEMLAEAGKSRLAALHAAALGPCACSGLWPAHLAKSVAANGISFGELCTDVLHALTEGRSETTPVLVMAGLRGGEGKSFFLKPLLELFGHEYVFPCPEPGTFPLLDLPGKKVVFLDDWRFDRTVLPFATQCRWYDGSVVRLQRPQNQNGTVGHVTYRGSAPIFATTKADDIQRLAHLASTNPATGQPHDINASMCLRRLKVYYYNVRVDKPAGKRIEYCPKCFAQVILAQAKPAAPGGIFV